MNFADNLMALRRSRGWSQEELGDKLNVSRQTVSKWETGQTTPELERLLELADLFALSLDELTGRERVKERVGEKAGDRAGEREGERAGKREGEGRGFFPAGECRCCPPPVYYEYVSPRRLWGLPLVHIRFGRDNRPAKGIVAVGNIALGLIAVGGIALGLIAAGGIGVGLLILGGLSVGVVSVGGVAVGVCAAGAVALGQWFALGGVAVSNCLAVGGVALSNQVAIGDAAVGIIAVGADAEGRFAFGPESDPELARQSVKLLFPRIWGLAKLFL